MKPAMKPSDSLERLEELAAELPDAVDREKRRRVAQEASNAADALESVAMSFDLWRENAVSWPDDLVPVGESFSAKVVALAQLASELERANTTGALEQLLVRWPVIASTMKDLLRDGELQWTTSSLAQLQWCDALGRALESVQATATVGGQLKEIYRLSGTLKAFPPKEASCKKLDELRATAASLKEGLKDLQVGESVERFLLALANGVALLSMVDDHVLAWVRKHRMTDQLKLTLR